jgi:hypothetical protein
VNDVFVKIGKILYEIDYQMRTAASAFESHSRSRLEKAIAKREMVAI